MKSVCLLLLVAISLSAVQALDSAGWRDKVIYQVMTDRFAQDVDTKGPCPNLLHYCNGTFKGIENHLDYITNLGVDAIWMSPIIENFEHGYHGYWAKNMYSVNPRYGTEASLHSLIDSAHKKGLLVMVDVVANHIGRGIEDVPNVHPFNNASYYHDCSACSSTCSVNNYTNVPMMHHCRLFGLPDLNQSMPIVRETLLSWISDMVSNYSFDGVRVDTVPYINKEFWTEFSAAAGVYTLGEVADGRSDFVANYQPNINGLFNFPMFYTLLDVFRDQRSMYLLSARITEVNQYFPDPSLLGTFLENHDQYRFLYQQPDAQLYRNAMLFVLTNTGVPVLYYGTEQGFAGDSYAAAGRKFGSASGPVPVHTIGDWTTFANGTEIDPLLSRQPLWTSGFPTTNTRHHLYEFIQTILKFRKVSKLSQEPQTEHFVADSAYAFSRGPNIIALTNVGVVGGQVNMILYNVTAEAGATLCNLFDSSACVVVSADRSVEISLVRGEAALYYPIATYPEAVSAAYKYKKRFILKKAQSHKLHMQNKGAQPEVAEQAEIESEVASSTSTTNTHPFHLLRGLVKRSVANARSVFRW